MLKGKYEDGRGVGIGEKKKAINTKKYHERIILWVKKNLGNIYNNVIWQRDGHVKMTVEYRG